jgi:protein gp37
VSTNTSIEWTKRPGTIGATLNPTTGCDKISEGCGLPRFDDDLTGGCYAMAMAKRLKAMGQAKYQNDGNPVTSGPGFGLTVHPDTLTEPLRWRGPRTVFVNSPWFMEWGVEQTAIGAFPVMVVES